MGKSLYLGIGLYTMPEAARILRVPVSKLRRWTQGYPFAGGRFSEPLFTREYPELVERRLLTFHDLIEANLVVQFRDAGVSMQTIRAAAKEANRRFSTNHPFAIHQFHTDGRRIFAELDVPDKDSRLYEEILKGQYVFDHVAPEFFKKLDYEQDRVRHYWPLGKDRPVVLDPARSFGRPIDPTSGVPTRALAGMYGAGDSVEEVADWFDVTPEAVRAAVEYEDLLARAA